MEREDAIRMHINRVHKYGWVPCRQRGTSPPQSFHLAEMYACYNSSVTGYLQCGEDIHSPFRIMERRAAYQQETL